MDTVPQPMEPTPFQDPLPLPSTIQQQQRPSPPHAFRQMHMYQAHPVQQFHTYHHSHETSSSTPPNYAYINSTPPTHPPTQSAPSCKLAPPLNPPSAPQSGQRLSSFPLPLPPQIPAFTIPSSPTRLHIVNITYPESYLRTPIPKVPLRIAKWGSMFDVEGMIAEEEGDERWEGGLYGYEEERCDEDDEDGETVRQSIERDEQCGMLAEMDRASWRMEKGKGRIGFDEGRGGKMLKRGWEDGGEYGQCEEMVGKKRCVKL